MNRRDFLRTAGGTAGATSAIAASGSATAAESGGGGTPSGGGGGGSVQPDFGGYLEGANGTPGSVADKRGSKEVTVKVGAGSGFAFTPTKLWIDKGTTVKFKWVGGSHNVVGEDNPLDSGSPASDKGVQYEFTFEETGIYKYFCSPHKGQGMKGGIAVGGPGDIKTKKVGGAREPLNPEHMGVPIQAHFVGIATLLAIAVSLVFTFFILKYGETPHTKGGNN